MNSKMCSQEVGVHLSSKKPLRVQSKLSRTLISSGISRPAGETIDMSIQEDGPNATGSDSKEYLKELELLYKRKDLLRRALSSDMNSCNAKWTLFVAAARGERFKRKLVPFPNDYVSLVIGDDITGLLSVIDDTPPLMIVLNCLERDEYDKIDVEIIDLLYWLIVDTEMSLKTVDKEITDTLLTSFERHKSCTLPRPTQIFKVCYSAEEEEKFKMNSKNHQTEFAFHGSKLDNVYAMMNRKQTHIAVHLTSDLSVALHHSPPGTGWGYSTCGAIISCVLLCEYIKNFEYVNEKVSITNNMLRRSTIVMNRDMLRVRYLLYYGRRYPKYTKPPPPPESITCYQWIRNHSTVMGVLFFLFVVATIYIITTQEFTFDIIDIVKSFSKQVGELSKKISPI